MLASYAPDARATKPCVLCGGTDAVLIAEHDRHGQPLRSVLCTDCGLVRVDPLPSVEQTRRFYGLDYRQQYKGAFEPKPKHCHRETLRAIARAEGFLAALPVPERTLDVGAGAGFFAYALKRFGVEIDGIEPNAAYAAFARERLGLERIRTGFLEDLPANGHYQRITLNHVLEHLPDPRAALRQMHGLLAPGGELLLEVPNIEARYHAPGHVFHIGHLHWFNPATIEALALQCGFGARERRLVHGTAHINLRLVRRESEAEAGEAQGLLEGNAARVLRARRGHTALRHYLGPTPYARAFRKVAQYAREQASTRGAVSARAMRRFVRRLAGAVRLPPLSPLSAGRRSARRRFPHRARCSRGARARALPAVGPSPKSRPRPEASTGRG